MLAGSVQNKFTQVLKGQIPIIDSFLNPLDLPPAGPLRALEFREAGQGFWSCDQRDWLFTSSEQELSVSCWQLCRGMQGMLSWQCSIGNIAHKYAAALGQGPAAERPHICMCSVQRG